MRGKPVSRRGGVRGGDRRAPTRAGVRPPGDRTEARAATSSGAEVAGWPEGGPGLPGVVVRAYGKYFDVQLHDEDRILLSTVRGALKRERRRTDLVAVGDRVWVSDVGEGEGQIEAVAPRTRVLARLARQTEDVEQVILANPDQVLMLFSVREPEPHRRMLDRFLVMAESRGLPAIVGVNKMDLDVPNVAAGRSLAETIFDDYRPLYPVRFVSAATGQGLDGLRGDLAGKVTVVAGPSGVGKSSLLNVLHPEGDRAVGEISAATGKGRHTTSATQLYRIGVDPETFVADTPGIRALALHGVPPETLDGCFPEFRPYLGRCFYADCTHLHEPDCAVRESLEVGAIGRERYESYAALRRGEGETDGQVLSAAGQ
jgi:ribosome biogenesis GTPase